MRQDCPSENTEEEEEEEERTHKRLKSFCHHTLNQNNEGLE
jgi:hypothetical protein